MPKVKLDFFITRDTGMKCKTTYDYVDSRLNMTDSMTEREKKYFFKQRNLYFSFPFILVFCISNFRIKFNFTPLYAVYFITKVQLRKSSKTTETTT